MKRTLLLFVAALISLSLVGMAFSATAVIKPLGVSDRGVAADTTDIFRYPTTGLGNVGVGEQVYLGGNPGEDSITAWAWELTAKPNGSNTALSANNLAVVGMRPDMIGTYTITLRVTAPSGQSDPVTYKVNAANFVGVGGIVAGDPAPPECIVCHNGEEDPKFDKWNQTAHAALFQLGYDGAEGSHYSSRCIRCHVVGYNAEQGAVNNGFDDMAAQEQWVFIDSAHGGQIPGAFDSMKVHFPQTAKRALIQCENCHGPGSAHNGVVRDNKIEVSLEVGVCAKCHDSGSHHIFPDQWKKSGHAAPPREDRTGCVACHSGKGFIQQCEGVPDSSKSIAYVPIGCASCHDSHDATNLHQVRTVEPYTLLNGVEVDFGIGNICVNCHHARRDAESYVERSAPSSHYGPHHSSQADMLVGTNAIEYGQRMGSVRHNRVIEGGCVGCHMYETPAGPGQNNVGAHTFAMARDGVENVEACVRCHGEIESFEDIEANGDWDNDGSVESVQMEIEGLMVAVTGMLPNGEGILDTSYTLAERRAYYNWKFVLFDGSKGMHNAAYARNILQASIANMLGVESVGEEIPESYSLSNAYPNPFNPSTSFNFSLARTGKVDLNVYDMAGRKVASVYSGERMAGSYRASVNLTDQPSGVYLLRMTSGSFEASKKLILVK